MSKPSCAGYFGDYNHFPVMSQKTVANGIGCLSIACSLAIWVWLFSLAFFFNRGVDLSDRWYVVFRPGVWFAFNGVGLSLALIAKALGLRRWGFAAIFAVVSFILAICILGQLVI
jgi:hypothetical protein